MKQAGVEVSTVMSLSEIPTFSPFLMDYYTVLNKNGDTDSYQFLPPSWNLLTCFEHYFLQKDKW